MNAFKIRYIHIIGTTIIPILTGSIRERERSLDTEALLPEALKRIALV